MALDPHYIPAFSIDEGPILDKDNGAPLSGGVVWFQYDNNRGFTPANLKPNYRNFRKLYLYSVTKSDDTECYRYI